MRISWSFPLFTAESAGAEEYNEFSGYDTKQSDSEAPVLLEFWGMWSTSSLPSLPCPFWSQVVALNKVLSMGQI